jgi:hypothetical protein
MQRSNATCATTTRLNIHNNQLTSVPREVVDLNSLMYLNLVGRAVWAGPGLTVARFSACLKLRYDEPLSNFGFNLKLRRYTSGIRIWLRQCRFRRDEEAPCFRPGHGGQGRSLVPPHTH